VVIRPYLKVVLRCTLAFNFTMPGKSGPFNLIKQQFHFSTNISNLLIVYD